MRDPRGQAKGYADPADELRGAARWCREELTRNPAARLLVVDTKLRLRRAHAVQAFEHELHGSDLLGPLPEALYGIEGGQPLSEYALVGAALDLLQLSAGALEFQRLASLLRSPYIGLRDAARSARRWNSGSASATSTAPTMRACASWPASRAPARKTHCWTRSSPSLRCGLSSPCGPIRARVGPGNLPRDLKRAGGPGKAPWAARSSSSASASVSCSPSSRRSAGSGRQLNFHQALDLLGALAMRTSFEAATPDVPVTLTESIDDPLIEYDGIWVAGLSAESWPAPPRADPFVPIPAQRAAGYQPASAQGQLQAARQAMNAWQRCSKQLVFSWPWADGDVPLQPSELLGAKARAHGEPIAPASPDRLMSSVRHNAQARAAAGRARARLARGQEIARRNSRAAIAGPVSVQGRG